MSVSRFRNSARIGALCAATLLGVSSQALAAGFYIQEQSVRGLGSAFSGSTTTLDDASTIYFNPAGMTALPGTQIQAGVHVLIPDSDLTDTGTTPPATAALGGSGGNPYDPTPVPNGFISHQISNHLWAGLSITAPFGLGNAYDKDWFGRFDSTKTKLKTINIQPTVAYKINDMISLGAGVNFQFATADLQNQVMLGVATEGTSRLKGDDWGYGYSLGMQFRPTDSTTLGVNYKSETHHDLDGSIRVTTAAGVVVAPGVVSTGGSAKLTTPDHLTLGLAQKITERLTLQGQAVWFGWNNFDNITAVRDSGAVASRVEQNYQTTWAFAAGAEYEASDRWTLRGGVQFDETPTTDEYRSTRTPDGDRVWGSLGATYALTPAIDLDMAGTYIHVADEEIDVTRTTATGNANIVADTEGQVGIVAVGLSYKF